MSREVWHLFGPFPRITSGLVLVLSAPLIALWGPIAAVPSCALAGWVLWRSLVISVAIDVAQNDKATITLRNWTRSHTIDASDATFSTTRPPGLKFLVVRTSQTRHIAHGAMFLGSPEKHFFAYQRRVVQELRREAEAVGVTFEGPWPPAATADVANVAGDHS
jgi:hypothetical protein